MSDEHAKGMTWFEALVYANYGAMEELLRITEDALPEILKISNNKISEEEKKSPPMDEADERYYAYAHDIVDTKYPRLIRYAFIQASYTAFEYTLRVLFEEHKKSFGHPIQLNELSGSEIEKIKTYFKKIAQIRFPDDIPLWANILRHKDIRDIITHHEGILNEDTNQKRKENVKKFIEDNPTILKLEDGTILPEKGYCEQSSKDFMDFFLELAKRISEGSP